MNLLTCSRERRRFGPYLLSFIHKYKKWVIQNHPQNVGWPAGSVAKCFTNLSTKFFTMTLVTIDWRCKNINSMPQRGAHRMVSITQPHYRLLLSNHAVVQPQWCRLDFDWCITKGPTLNTTTRPQPWSQKAADCKTFAWPSGPLFVYRLNMNWKIDVDFMQKTYLCDSRHIVLTPWYWSLPLITV